MANLLQTNNTEFKAHKSKLKIKSKTSTLLTSIATLLAVTMKANANEENEVCKIEDSNSDLTLADLSNLSSHKANLDETKTGSLASETELNNSPTEPRTSEFMETVQTSEFDEAVELISNLFPKDSEQTVSPPQSAKSNVEQLIGVNDVANTQIIVSSIGVSNPILPNTAISNVGPVSSSNSNSTNNSFVENNEIKEDNTQSLIETIDLLIAERAAAETAHQETISSMIDAASIASEENALAIASLTSQHSESVSILQDQIDSLIASGDEYHEEMSQIILDLTAQINDLDVKLEISIQQIIDLDAANAELHTEIIAILAEREAAEITHQKTVNQLIETMNQASEDCKIKMEAIIEQHSMAIEALETQISEAIDQGTLSAIELNETISVLSAQISGLETSLEAALNKIIELETNLLKQDTLTTGTKASDHIFGGDGNDQLFGLDNKDYLSGGAGADLLDGGDGEDDVAEYVTSETGVKVSLKDGVGYEGDAAGDQLVNIEFLHGSLHNDWLEGDHKNNRLEGRLGEDELFGLEGDDLLLGGYGADILDGGEGVDTASYHWSDDGVIANLKTGEASLGEAEGDTFISIENLSGSTQDDMLTGDDLSNRIWGDDGDDTLFGGEGNDRLVGGLGADHLDGGAGDRDIADYTDAETGVILDLAGTGTGGEALGDSFSEIEYVYGSSHGDSITGDTANNRLVGNDGDDMLFGADGNDYILGNAGNDTLNGGAGNDVFIFDEIVGDDTISDFEAGAGRTDRVWLKDQGIDTFDQILENSTQVDGNVVITIDTGSITLENLQVSDLHSDDFIIG